MSKKQETTTMPEDIFELPVHPAADVFPMLDADELQELADDIKANGLNHPVVIGKFKGKTVLIDGRNRREACRIAEVIPETVEFTGDDAPGFIVSENINRRHLMKGQRAMAVAVIYPEPEKGGRGNTKSFATKEFSEAQVSKARTILKHAPELADNVLSGAFSLDAAYETALERKRAAEGDAGKLETLKAEAPDLATRVVEDGADLSEQMAALKQRKENERMNRLATFKFLRGIFGVADCLTPPDYTHELLERYPAEFEKETGRTVAEFFKALQEVGTAFRAIRK